MGCRVYRNDIQQMTRQSALLLLLVLALCSCVNTQTKRTAEPNYEVFEVSYTNGWTSNFSVLTDSNRFYIAPGPGDTTFYGLLPIEIVNLLNTTVSELRTASKIKSRNEDCTDCAALAIRVVAEGDTMRINQYGSIDSLFYPLVESLLNHIENGDHQRLRALVLLETHAVVVPPSPPYVEGLQLTVPE